MKKGFDFGRLFSSASADVPIQQTLHAKYDFAVAYPAPETLPLDGLLEGIRNGLEEEGRDLAYYPDNMGYRLLRELVAEK